MRSSAKQIEFTWLWQCIRKRCSSEDPLVDYQKRPCFSSFRALGFRGLGFRISDFSR